MVFLHNSIPAEKLSSIFEQVLSELTALGYQNSTISVYQCALRKITAFMKYHGISYYSHEVGKLFLEKQLMETGLSKRWCSYMKTAIRRLDDHIQKSHLK